MRHLGAALLITAALAALGTGAGCGNGGTTTSGTGGAGGSVPPLTTDELMDPQSCAKCHPDHVKEWSGSMHAYASDDPVFLAMNARGQRETKGALGNFCVNCHAPLAVKMGVIKDGTGVEKLPAQLHGVTCFFCHSVDEVKGTHDNPLTLATDGVMRSSISDPVPTGAHKAAYSPLFDRSKAESSGMCGSCHDIVTPLGAHLERTYAEWQGTLFAHPDTLLSCNQCHMDGRNGLAAQAPGVKVRRVHAHNFPGVDVALSDFPEAQAQRDAVQASLDTTLQSEICVKGADSPGATIQVVLDNVGAGHLWPSGVVHDRRAWVEVIAYAAGKTIYQSGVIADGESVVKSQDPDLWLLRECLFDEQDQKVDMFWQAKSLDANQLPGPTTNVQTDPAYYLTHVVRTFPRPTSMPPSLATPPDRVTMRVRIIPVGYDVIDDLVASGDLDAAIKSKLPVFTLGATVTEWTEATATIKYLDQGIPVSCVSTGLSTGANSATPAPEKTKCSP